MPPKATAGRTAIRRGWGMDIRRGWGLDLTKAGGITGTSGSGSPRKRKKRVKTKLAKKRKVYRRRGGGVRGRRRA